MWEILLTIAVVGFTAFYFYVRYKMTYWRWMGVAEDPGSFPFGAQFMKDFIFRRTSFFQMTDEVYKRFPDAPFVGTYGMLGSPTLLIRDPDLAKRVLIKDFDQFMERKPKSSHLHSKNNRHLPYFLLELQGDQWKKVRASLSPGFTSGKLKSMVPLIHRVADNCNECLSKKVGESFLIKDVLGNFSMDVIVSTGFGYESNTFKDPSNIFKKHADLLVTKKLSLRLMAKVIVFMFAPRLARWLDFHILDPEAEQFFVEAILKAIKERQESGERRNDFIDICTDVLKKEAENPTNFTISDNTTDQQMKDDARKKEVERILIANSIIMFMAGYNQVSTVATMMLYFMAKNPEYQERFYQEISEAVKVAGTDQLDYPVVMNLPYMEMFFQETFRMYPFGHLERASVKPYKIPGTDVTIPKDVIVRFAAGGIAKDPKYYPNPEVFNPENFTAANKNARHPLASGGFGHGPRNCIAQRFATMEIKILIARILTKFRILPCNKTIDVLIPNPRSRQHQPIGEIWITVELRS